MNDVCTWSSAILKFTPEHSMYTLIYVMISINYFCFFFRSRNSSHALLVIHFIIICSFHSWWMYQRPTQSGYQPTVSMNKFRYFIFHIIWTIQIRTHTHTQLICSLIGLRIFSSFGQNETMDTEEGEHKEWKKKNEIKLSDRVIVT